jgi:fibro-slime domain-containing protein
LGMATSARIFGSIGLACFLLAVGCSTTNGSFLGGDIGGNGGGVNTGNPQGGGGSVLPGSGGATQLTISTEAVTELAKTCGNSTLDTNEQCDDGNKTGGDGCTKLCQIENEWACPDVGKACVSSVKCGDGKLASTETCDDGNTNNDDGCSGDCKTVADGYQCRVPGKRCVPLCGDSKIIGGETCDDANDTSNDGCSSTCLVEPGWSCEGTPSKCTKSDCGNGKQEAGEGCDLGKAENGLFYGDAKGCSKTCTKEPNCRPDGKTTQACTTTCGDGNRDPNEDCDDGNAVNGDGCSSECKKEDGFTCNDMDMPDTTDCSSGGGKCLVMPIIYRDFEGQQVSGGHPDFFYYGAAASNGRKTGVIGGATKTTCVPNAGGTKAAFNPGDKCPSTDATGPCLGLVQATLGGDGKPVYAKGTCPCVFTDWDKTDLLGTCPSSGTGTCTPAAGLSGVQDCWVEGPGDHRLRVDTTVTVIQDEASFKQWYHDDPNASTTVKGTLELAASGSLFQFSSSVPGAAPGTAGRTVYDDLHDICLASNKSGQLKTGFFPLEAQSKKKVCNIWPYWKSGLDTDATCCAGAGCAVLSQWDPKASYDNCPTAGTGGPVPKSDGSGGKVTGLMRNFYFTSEARYLFRFDSKVGGGTLSFFGDDDVWVFINGKLALDLGAPHERLQGSVAVTASTFGLEDGKIYEIAVFHADRHPRESNYQLTLSSFSTKRTSCLPRCGDTVVTAGEECDDGDGKNSDTAYGGCTTKCKFGPYCGDEHIDSPDEDCDNGTKNGEPYGTPNGCTNACKKVHYCGDGIIDSAFGEECDGGSTCTKDCHAIWTSL